MGDASHAAELKEFYRRSQTPGNFLDVCARQPGI
jgi:hypothetical protein